jgi:hypothetical protein
MAMTHCRWREGVGSSILIGLLLAASAVQASPPLFTEFDFQGFLGAHPLVRQFDPVTHRFPGTPSAFRPPDDLDRELGKIRGEARQTHQEEAALLKTSMTATGTSDDEFWLAQKRLQERMTTLTHREAVLQALVIQGGKTDQLSIVPQVDRIMTDLAGAGPGTGTIRLNRLPRLVTDLPEFGMPNPWLLFQWTKEPSLLVPYLRQSYVVGMLFRSATAPILYARPRQE